VEIESAFPLYATLEITRNDLFKTKFQDAYKGPLHDRVKGEKIYPPICEYKYSY
jgi:hypothetical protein